MTDLERSVHAQVPHMDTHHQGAEMTTNQDRALRLLNDLAENQDGAGVFDAVTALADAGLLAPDLPHADRDGRWWPTAASIGSVRVTPAGEVALHSGNFRDMNLYLTPDKARDLADILNAAADHAEEAGRADA